MLNEELRTKKLRISIVEGWVSIAPWQRTLHHLEVIRKQGGIGNELEINYKQHEYSLVGDIPPNYILGLRSFISSQKLVVSRGGPNM